MEEMERLFKTAIDEIERMLNSKTVVGEPITVAGRTIIPLVSVGFGFGAGGGSDPLKGGGSGMGTGGGGGVKPVAVLVVDESGVRLESVKSGAASAFEKAVDTVAKTVRRQTGEKGE